MPLDPAVIAATSGILGSIVGATPSHGSSFKPEQVRARYFLRRWWQAGAERARAEAYL